MNNMLDYWQHLRTRVITGEGDSILCINTRLPEGMIGCVDSVCSADEIPSSRYDLIVASELFRFCYRHGDMLAEVCKHIKGKGVFILAETVVDVEDACLNALVFTCDSAHVRFPRAEEVISSMAGYLNLREFLVLERDMEMTIPAGIAKDKILAQIETFPQDVMFKTSPVVNGDKITFTTSLGLFVWQK